MQIITGKYRARKLDAVRGDTTRPTLARVKESIFNLLSVGYSNLIVLDLFAGSGAYGIECISRGAKKVIFVDREKEAVRTIANNTRNMNDDFEIIHSDYEKALNNFAEKKLKFDLVFLDPPYKSGYLQKSLELLHLLKLLKKGAIIVCEHEFENDLQSLPNCYIIEKSRKYGIAYVDIIVFNG